MEYARFVTTSVLATCRPFPRSWLTPAGTDGFLHCYEMDDMLVLRSKTPST
jgi:hypothetical protein